MSNHKHIDTALSPEAWGTYQQLFPRNYKDPASLSSQQMPISLVIMVQFCLAWSCACLMHITTWIPAWIDAGNSLVMSRSQHFKWPLLTITNHSKHLMYQPSPVKHACCSCCVYCKLYYKKNEKSASLNHDYTNLKAVTLSIFISKRYMLELIL